MLGHPCKDRQGSRVWGHWAIEGFHPTGNRKQLEVFGQVGAVTRGDFRRVLWGRAAGLEREVGAEDQRRPEQGRR